MAKECCSIQILETCPFQIFLFQIFLFQISPCPICPFRTCHTFQCASCPLVRVSPTLFFVVRSFPLAIFYPFRFLGSLTFCLFRSSGSLSSGIWFSGFLSSGFSSSG